MKIAIIGTGGVGGYFGGKLAYSGNDVTFLARGQHLKAIQEKGLTVKSIHGDFVVTPAKATDQIKNIGTVDLIILGLKAWQVKDIALELPQIMHDTTIVLPLQNGVLAAEELKECMPPKYVLGGLCRIISKIDAPGVINHIEVSPTIVFGELDNAKTERVTILKQLFDQAGFNSRIADDIDAELWRKFIFICVSGLMAITKSSYGQVMELKETRQLMTELMNEIFSLSQKMGIKLEPDYVEKTVEYAAKLDYNASTSLARDVWEGKPSEIEYQNGTVVRLAEKYGVATPINRFIYECILPMEKRARKNK